MSRARECLLWWYLSFGCFWLVRIPGGIFELCNRVFTFLFTNDETRGSEGDS
jgi:hypothetical protein